MRLIFNLEKVQQEEKPCKPFQGNLNGEKMIFQTKRLKVRKAETSDVDMYLSLWNSGKVMKNVGFPNGLGISEEEFIKKIEEYDESEFDKSLVVIEKESGKKIGECKLGSPNEEGISSPDVKFLPEYWGKGFGKELLNALCKYIFSKTQTKIIETSPNVKNIASQKIVEAVGGKEIKRFVYHFPPEMQHFTEDVHGKIYHAHKKDWLEKNMRLKKIKNKEEKSRICKKIIELLPNWFGIPEANEAYIKGVEDTDFYTAYMFEKEVGFFSIISHFKETSEIYVCGVLPDFHRLGIGRELLQFAVQELEQQEKKFLTVKTLSSAHPDKGYACTREFYKKNGFIPLEEFKDLWGEANPCLFLVKRL
ncbi:MAG: GNAT family N-acetyltransferase [Candidatus Cloacimonetes bacterium]|nr:GNAT family N-acetyltransferase [Candidatus Cloacimonadota bacterium]MCF7815238.1 GNAT family N-acetyltransferase [Candidatus Cloacimonadota bacterium]MCF7867317.1 GNAT family N-acetyltransferase [Candidatus Cloacimonadota bacterium]MCF7884707.1 GNAT family N-acetyltransferase [Candidatus Cloacimonadota bacterium]